MKQREGHYKKRPAKQQPNHPARRHERNPNKSVFELLGPCGRLLAQAKTPDQARGVYLAAFPAIPRDLGSILVLCEVCEPEDPYVVIQHKRNRPKISRRYP